MSERFDTYQHELYVQGLEGTKPAFTTDATKLEDSAATLMTPEPFHYVAAGAGCSATTRANRAAFDRWRIVPRMLTDSTERDLSTSVLGTAMPAPVLLAPVGAQSIVHPEAELGSARAASALGLPMVLSTAASNTIEDVASAAGDGPRWFQLYWPTEPDVCSSILARAKQAGYSTLVVTLDTWTLAWRPSDLDHAYLPFLHGEGMAIPLSDPVFRGMLDATPEEDPPAAILRWLTMISGTDKSWSALPFLREHWDGPIVLKGIQHVDAARPRESRPRSLRWLPVGRAPCLRDRFGDAAGARRAASTPAVAS